MTRCQAASRPQQLEIRLISVSLLRTYRRVMVGCPHSAPKPLHLAQEFPSVWAPDLCHGVAIAHDVDRAHYSNAATLGKVGRWPVVGHKCGCRHRLSNQIDRLSLPQVLRWMISRGSQDVADSCDLLLVGGDETDGRGKPCCIQDGLQTWFIAHSAAEFPGYGVGPYDPFAVADFEEVHPMNNREAPEHVGVENEWISHSPDRRQLGGVHRLLGHGSGFLVVGFDEAQELLWLNLQERGQGSHAQLSLDVGVQCAA